MGHVTQAGLKTHCVVKDDLALPSLLPPSPVRGHIIDVVLGMELRALCMLDKHSANKATFPGQEVGAFLKINKKSLKRFYLEGSNVIYYLFLQTVSLDM